MDDESVTFAYDVRLCRPIMALYKFLLYCIIVLYWMMTEMSWEMDEEVNRDDNGEADGMNLEVDSKDEVMHN